GREVLHEKMTSGELVAFFTSFALMLDPIRKFNELNIRFNQCAAAAENVFAILDVKPEIQDKPDARPVEGFKREIRFEGVEFRYREGQPVLQGFDFTLRKGEVVALVGASGAGKSTVLGLIPRFFDPARGIVKLDGLDLRDLQLDSLRAQVALVTQEVFLFHDTVAANVKAGVHFASDEDVERALKAAQAWDYVQGLPQGIHTTIGDRGQKLSGGERQRLSIARAILKNAPILLLDEATSALDTENERLVQAALDELMVGRTAVVVAHRLSTIRKAHRILVMEKGRIVEEGSHDELLERSGAYARALALQGGFGQS
ncbi:MAG: ATP-binding cassette domain-containing protein, partial [Bdellovibrionales bacterium]|nr:ATP-binding cassette domain-containing protein [Bdellovibrionales bacterium]